MQAVDRLEADLLSGVCTLDWWRGNRERGITLDSAAVPGTILTPVLVLFFVYCFLLLSFQHGLENCLSSCHFQNHHLEGFLFGVCISHTAVLTMTIIIMSTENRKKEDKIVRSFWECIISNCT